jgi:ribonucleotide monophosphatase NagD (HAD superfamily)
MEHGMAALPETIDSLDALFPRYDALLCDVWGVVHNGETHFPAAAAALKRARQAGLAVVLITNSPRRGGDVIAQMGAIGVPDGTFDRLVSSGDVTRDLIAEGPRRVFHIGPDRDSTSMTGLTSNWPRSSRRTSSSAPVPMTMRSIRRTTTTICSSVCVPATCLSSAPIPTSWWSAATG